MFDTETKRCFSANDVVRSIGFQAKKTTSVFSYVREERERLLPAEKVVIFSYDILAFCFFFFLEGIFWHHLPSLTFFPPTFLSNRSICLLLLNALFLFKFKRLIL